jgi:hypothetical protein
MSRLFSLINDPIHFQTETKFFLTEPCIQSLKLNHREHYRQLGENIEKRIQSNDISESIIQIMDYKKRCVSLKSGIILKTGEIYLSQKSDHWYRNGACINEKAQMPRLNYDEIWNGQHMKFRQVITLTGLWSNGIWHFPMETLPSLMCVSKEDLKTAIFHVNKKSNYVNQWFSLLDIPENRIVDGNILAYDIIVPEQGKCGTPYPEQIQWLRSKIEPRLLYKDEPQNLLIVIRRSTRRVPRNQKQLEDLCESIANDKGLQLYIHDDQSLPSLIEQLSIFNRAKIVVSPHGAGGVMSISCRKDTTFIEFLNKENINICYFHLCNIMGLNYLGLSSENLVLNLNEFKENMDKIEA